MERSSSSSRPNGAGGNENGVPPPPYNMGRPGQMPYPNGFRFAASPMAASPDPQQQRLLQLQIRQQQIHLQQLQHQSQQQAQQQQQQRMSSAPPSASQQAAARFAATPLNNKSQPTPSPQTQKDTPPIQRKIATIPPSDDQIRQWVAQCDWKDKTIHISRQLLGGSTINGFLRATASAQRIKKQRARQFVGAKKNAKKAAELVAPGSTSPERQLTEDELKIGTMNARTAHKIKTETEQGLQFVKTLYENIQTILKELDPTGMNLPPPIERPARVMNPPVAPIVPPKPIMPPTPIKPVAAAAPLDALSSGSTLRKYRKGKVTIPPLEVQLEEHDVNGKRLFTKKEHGYQIAEILRFRSLRGGDYVAARVSSRDLWILARVARDYPSINMNPNDFLKLTLAKRDGLFREKVVVKDAEEKESGEPIFVSRQLVLPLARSYGEAAEWGSRLRKGMRVYAMYPNTTSLYVATVVDNMTFCRGDDDIIVVEFDEDEKGTIVC
jgi:TolA-binding protein